MDWDCDCWVCDCWVWDCGCDWDWDWDWFGGFGNDGWPIDAFRTLLDGFGGRDMEMGEAKVRMICVNCKCIRLPRYITFDWLTIIRRASGGCISDIVLVGAVGWEVLGSTEWRNGYLRGSHSAVSAQIAMLWVLL